MMRVPMLSDRELAALLVSIKRSSNSSYQLGLRKLLAMYAKVLDAEGHLEAGLLSAFLEETE
jgi:hypothetical protein